MGDWVRAHPYTLLAAVLLGFVVAWLILTGQTWASWLVIGTYIGVGAWRGIEKARRNDG